MSRRRAGPRGPVGHRTPAFATVVLAALLSPACSDTGVQPSGDDDVVDDDDAVENSPPEAEIVLPVGGTRFEQGAEATFRGEVSDSETLPSDLDCTWSSSLEELLFEGAADADGGTSFTTSALSPGLHTIELSVLDADGASGSHTIEVLVLAEAAPTITILSPDPALPHHSDLPASLQAAVADAEDPPGDLRVSWTDGATTIVADLVPDPGGIVTASAALAEGTHVLTATVVDTAGRSAADTVTIEVGPPIDSGPCDSPPTYVLPTCQEPTGVFFSDISSATGPAIWRMDIDGTNLTQVNDRVADDLEVDLAGSRLYWVHADSIIERGPLSGPGYEVVQAALPYAYGIALDPFARHIYWTNQVGVPKVQRSCMWGGDVVDVVPGLGLGGNCCAIGLDIDFANQRLHWMDGYYGGPVTRSNLDGTGMTSLYNTPGIGNGVAVDHRGAKVYWTEYGNSGGQDAIRRANLDGSSVETLLQTAQGLDTPQHIAVDPAGGKIYWADLRGATKIGRANLDGSNVESLYTGAGDVRAIALERTSPCQ